MHALTTVISFLAVAAVLPTSFAAPTYTRRQNSVNFQNATGTLPTRALPVLGDPTIPEGVFGFNLFITGIFELEGLDTAITKSCNDQATLCRSEAFRLGNAPGFDQAACDAQRNDCFGANNVFIPNADFLDLNDNSINNLQAFEGIEGGFGAPAVVPVGGQFALGPDRLANQNDALLSACRIQSSACVDVARTSGEQEVTILACVQQESACRDANGV